MYRYIYTSDMLCVHEMGQKKEANIWYLFRSYGLGVDIELYEGSIGKVMEICKDVGF